MSYVKQVLQPGEQIPGTSSIHWIGYWRELRLNLVAQRCAAPDRLLRDTAYALALVSSSVLLVQESLKWWVTEIAVTSNRRVIYKTGLIWRQTNE